MSDPHDPQLPEHAEPSEITGNVGGIKVTANKDGFNIDAPKTGALNAEPKAISPADAFVGLPMGLLICGPIIEVAKGQAELCKVYLEYIQNLAYEVKGDKKVTRVLSFELQRPVTDKTTGDVGTKTVTVNAPLISLVPVPAFLMEETTVRFNMEVKESKVDKESTATKVEAQTGFSFWGCRTSITGGVTHNSSSEVSSATTAQYEVYARARQQPPAEGMAKLTALFASMVEPIDMEPGS